METLNPSTLESDRMLEPSLRPKSLEEFVGQDKLKEKLGLFMKAAKARGESLDHVLFSGPPGLGKTTLAHVIANEMRGVLHSIAGPNIDKKGDLAAVLTNLQPGDVLFIDEIHRLAKPIEEILYGAMEDFKLEIIIGQGASAKTLKIELPKFTLIGATTRSGLISKPLFDRFGIQMHMDFYPVNELSKIISRSSTLLGVQIESSACFEIAKRARGTPRIANRLLKRIRDFSQVNAGPDSKSEIPQSLVCQGLDFLEIDPLGLDPTDRKYLLSIIDVFQGGPVGIESLAAALSEEKDTLEDIYEPFLIQQGFVNRTSRGRMAGLKAYAHFGREAPDPENNP